LLHFCCGSLWARPVASQRAQKVVAGWLRADARPFRTPFARRALNVQTFNDDQGQPAYYIVYLRPSGFVIVSADDSLEPIIGFADDGTFDPSLENPLGALVTNDLKTRIIAVRSSQLPQFKAHRQKAPYHRDKWDRFTALAEASDGNVGFMGITSVSDIRVHPLLQSKWSQHNICSSPCYNYYTPENYYTGCVATAMAQLMRYHQHPSTAIGVKSFSIQKNSGTPYSAYTLGGDEAGGPYNWSSMVLVPSCSTSNTQRKAIGALCYDAAISININFGSSSSEADTLKSKNALINTFKYGNAITGYNNSNNIGPGLTAMLNPNLDAKDPVIIGIKGSSGGHAVICDGYGYNSSTLYHHLNMGWSGTDNAWYNLPTIDATYLYSSVYKCVYNIRISAAGNGEIISGRLLDQNGDPLHNALISATGSSSTFEETSDAKGIYAFDLLNSNTLYTLNPSAEGYVFSPRIITTKRSRDRSSVSGNVWGVDFDGQILEISTITPASGPPGTYMKIQGQNFGSTTGDVLFPGGKLGEELQWSDTVIYCRAPGDATSGDIQVRTAALDLSSPKYFDVTNPATIIVDIGGFTTNIENGTNEYPFGGIQKGIDAATPGDAVIVKQGNYPETIQFTGNNITLTSLTPSDPDVVASTVIDGGLLGPVVTFDQGEDAACLMTGFTITNGDAPNGGAIFCCQSSPTISYCTIKNNSANNGGAMYNTQSSPALVNCSFTANSAANKGGAMYNDLSSPTLANCILIANLAGDDGGAIYNKDFCSPIIANCTLSANSANDTAGAIFNSNISAVVVINNSILWENSDKTGIGESAQIYNGKPIIKHSCIQGWTGILGGIGNIGSDPNFVRNPDHGGDGWGIGANDDFGDLRLSPASPCIDAGDNTAVPPDTADLDDDGDTIEIIPYDFRGLSRLLDVPLTVDTGNPGESGPPIVDMGAHEFASFVAHWKLDESAGSKAEDSEGTNDGSLYGDPVWLPLSGIFDGALLFDGNDDYVWVLNESNFDLTDAATIAAWININDVGADYQAIVTKGDSAWRLSTVASQRRIYFAVTAGPPSQEIRGDIQIPPYEWHHVCGTYDGNDIRLYIDGQEDPAGPVAYSGQISTNDYNVCIGENAELTQRHWDGLIDEVRIYNYALETDELTALLCPQPYISDINRDCVVNMADYAAFALAWLSVPENPGWNQNCNIATPTDNIINMLDLAVFVENWLPHNQ